MIETALRQDQISSVRDRLDRPVALIGMMGTGKTRLGKMLADALDLPFIDTDQEIEQASGLSIPEIFERFGEPYFREGERRILHRVTTEDPCVIATGGGAILNPDTRNELHEKTVMIWIKAELPVMLTRTGKTDRRPLLKNGDPADILRKLTEERYPLYAGAHLTVDSSGDDSGQTLAAMLKALAQHLDQEKAHSR